jgi:hypothetical protein
MSLNNLVDFLAGLDNGGTFTVHLFTPVSGEVEQLVHRFGEGVEQLTTFRLRDVFEIVALLNRVQQNPHWELRTLRWEGRNEFTVEIEFEYNEVNAWIPSANLRNELQTILGNGPFHLRVRRIGRRPARAPEIDDQVRLEG